ncbi:TPA: peptidylprolyl isomerase, partial [Methanosarcinaceae archaeon]|nr:peptidylprolyl isomerase [Methanosarcinaceae archaeon]
PEVGMQLATDTGLRGTITEVDEEGFVIDFNHMLAGKARTFKVTLVSVEA